MDSSLFAPPEQKSGAGDFYPSTQTEQSHCLIANDSKDDFDSLSEALLVQRTEALLCLDEAPSPDCRTTYENSSVFIQVRTFLHLLFVSSGTCFVNPPHKASDLLLGNRTHAGVETVRMA